MDDVTIASGSRVAVVGGGLAGLTSAALLARRGFEVDIFEGAGSLGGRGRTDEVSGFSFNLGPHALYVRGEGRRVLRELGVPCDGSFPAGKGMNAVRDGRLYAFPGGTLNLLRTRLLGWSQKVETARLLGSIPRLDASEWAGRTVDEWLAEATSGGQAAELLRAVFRLSTYANDPGHLDAGAALAQLQLALAGNVYYLDGGWRTLVDGLERCATAAGARVHREARVEALVADASVTGIEVRGRGLLEADAVVLAIEPEAVARLVGAERAPTLVQRLAACRKVKAACLDVGLSALPRPDRDFGLGIDGPFYLSVHSASAALAPPGAALVHVAKYLAPDETGSRAELEAQLEDFLELLQPGWRDRLVERRLMPGLVVTHDIHQAERPAVPERVAEVPGLWLAGDWVGARGMLADRAFASAATAAAEISDEQGERQVA